MAAFDPTDAKPGAAPEHQIERKPWQTPQVIISQAAFANKIPTTTELPAYGFGLAS